MKWYGWVLILLIIAIILNYTQSMWIGYFENNGRTKECNYINYLNKITGGASFDKDTGYVSASYTDSSGGCLAETTFTVTKVGALEEVHICTVTNTSSAGTMRCYIGTLDGIYSWSLDGTLINGNPYLISNGWLEK